MNHSFMTMALFSVLFVGGGVFGVGMLVINIISLIKGEDIGRTVKGSAPSPCSYYRKVCVKEK